MTSNPYDVTIHRADLDPLIDLAHKEERLRRRNYLKHPTPERRRAWRHIVILIERSVFIQQQALDPNAPKPKRVKNKPLVPPVSTAAA